MNEDLQGKVAVVTGASAGIGEATALALAEAGAKVAIAARRADRLEALAERLGEAALPIAADVADEAQCNELIRRAKDELGSVDILVNNAGQMLLGPIEGADTEDWRRMVGVNMLGLMYCTHAALPVMREQGGGHVVNVSSVADRRASAFVAVYNATKFAVCGFSEALRQEAFPHDIRVTVIEPGAVATELQAQSTNPVAREAAMKYVAGMDGPLQADDIAAAILYAVTQPKHVNVNELLVRPTKQTA